MSGRPTGQDTDRAGVAARSKTMTGYGHCIDSLPDQGRAVAWTKDHPDTAEISA
jgi:hypothetical protein